jgi:hypothetical protein
MEWSIYKPTVTKVFTPYNENFFLCLLLFIHYTEKCLKSCESYWDLYLFHVPVTVFHMMRHFWENWWPKFDFTFTWSRVYLRHIETKLNSFRNFYYRPCTKFHESPLSKFGAVIHGQTPLSCMCPLSVICAKNVWKCVSLIMFANCQCCWPHKIPKALNTCLSRFQCL